MKKVLLLTVVLLISFCGTIQAQNTQRAKDLLKKQERKEKREERKTQDSILNIITFDQAYQALRNQNFVLEADNIIFWNGVTRYVTSNTNFISLYNGKAIVQTAFENGYSGPNGLGGITLEGSASGIRMNTDKEGNVFFDMNVQGVNISATVTVILTRDTNRASANVNPNFSGNDITFTGNLYPSALSNVFKAMPNLFPNMLNPIY
ncbi:MAG: DUF4251 domain-containing protein [Bacteroidaceae bacterium]